MQFTTKTGITVIVADTFLTLEKPGYDSHVIYFDEYFEVDKQPVLNEDGSLKNFMPRISGTSFHCKCGCNVFHKPDQNDLELYQCNSCDATYRGKPA